MHGGSISTKKRSKGSHTSISLHTADSVLLLCNNTYANKETTSKEQKAKDRKQRVGAMDDNDTSDDDDERSLAMEDNDTSDDDDERSQASIEREQAADERCAKLITVLQRKREFSNRTRNKTDA